MPPNFPANLAYPVLNHLTGAQYTLRRVDEVEVTEQLVDALTVICNQAEIYRWLFHDLFHGRAYEARDAEYFFESGVNGWQRNNAFVFMLLASNGAPAAAIDIKSASLNHAEVGYWASAEHRGVMTNTVRAVVALAREAGYRQLFGRARKENTASAQVLQRSGFVFDPQQSIACVAHDYFVQSLIS